MGNIFGRRRNNGPDVGAQIAVALAAQRAEQQAAQQKAHAEQQELLRQQSEQHQQQLREQQRLMAEKEEQLRQEQQRVFEEREKQRQLMIEMERKALEAERDKLNEQFQREQEELKRKVEEEERRIKAEEESLRQQQENLKREQEQIEEENRRAEEELTKCQKQLDHQRAALTLELEISQAEVENLKEKVIQAQRQIGLDSENFYNFGFPGHAKAGKSSLINSLLGLYPTDPGAAKVGAAETTHDITPYQPSNGACYKLWDLPGAATVSHPSPNYFYDNALCAFDCLALLIQNTFTVEEIKFAIDAIRHKVPIVFIKSKMDHIYKDMVTDGHIDKNVYTTPQQQANKAVEIYRIKIRETLVRHADKMQIREELRKVLLETKLFFVSARAMVDQVLNINEVEVKFEEAELRRELFRLAGFRPSTTGLSAID